MSVYEPLRDTFREFNNMLIDAQQWDERHAQNTADRELKQQMLLSELEQQQFNNNMANKEFTLRRQGQERLAEESLFNRMHTNRKWDLEKKAAGRDAAFHVQRMKQMKTEQANLELDLKQKQELAATREGMLGNATREVFIDPIARATKEGAGVLKEIKSLEARYSKMKDARFTPARAGIERRINQAKAKLAEVSAPAQSSQAKVETWRAQAAKARELGLEWFNKGDTQTGQALMDIADDYDDYASGEIAANAKSAADAAKAVAEDEWDKRYDRFAKQFGQLDANNQIFLNPAAKARVALAQQWSTKLANDGKTVTDPETGKKTKVKLSQSDLFMEGITVVSTVEKLLEADLAGVDDELQQGILKPEEAAEERQKIINDFIKDYEYDPRGLNVSPVK